MNSREQRRTDPQALVQADMPFAEVVKFCRAPPDWEEKFERLDFRLLSLEAKRIFGVK